ITREECERYFRTYYAPNNCTLVLVGDFEPSAALREIERLYGGISAGDGLPRIATGEPRQKGERRAVIRYPSQAPAMLAGFRGPSGRDPDSLVLDLIEAALHHQRPRAHRRPDGGHARLLARDAGSAGPVRRDRRRGRTARRAQDLSASSPQRGDLDPRRGGSVIAHDVELPPLQIEKMPSGLTLLAVQKRGLPLFHVRLSLPAGACEDPRGKAGLAHFTLELLRRGTRRR